MNDNPQPVTTAPSDVDPTRAPRVISHDQMCQHQQTGLATALSRQDRHRMFVRYDGLWWISDPDGFTEVTSTSQNRRLDRWHERLTNGALWT